VDYFLLSKILRPFLAFSNIFILLIIIFFFIKKKNIYFKSIFKLLVVFYLVIGIFPVGKFIKYHLLNKDYINQENKLNFDSILVLSGNEARYLRAINLYKQNPNSKLIFSGGSGLIISKNRTEEVNNFKYLTVNLIKNDKLIILDDSRNTIENLKNFKVANEKYKFKKTVLVTTISHYKRSLYIAKKLKLDLVPYYYQIEKIPFSLLNYYQNYSFSKNWGQFDKLMFELIGILRVIILRI
tara:strand:- start:273 stop:992 length:720 start_codon:yes stop_codon:yes gene_type:complete